MKLYREGSRGIRDISGSLLFVENLKDVGYGERVTIESGSGAHAGQVLRAGSDFCVVQVFDDTTGLESGRSAVWLERDILRVGVGEVLRGCVLDGRGRFPEGGNLYDFEELLPVNGLPVNPAERISPSLPLETGISVVDLMNTLVRGQKLPVFAGPGLPANELVVQIARQALIPDDGATGEKKRFLVVFAAMGLTGREADYFLDAFQGDIQQNGILLLNTAGDPVAERLLTPRVALTLAEYFAFVKGYDVLVILTDMLCYCEALRETRAALGRPSGPGCLYSDLARIYERAGCIAGLPGSITLIPVVCMPDDDIAHPAADLSGYIAEGQIVLDRRLHEAGIFPPVDVVASLSRSMDRGTGRGRTFDSHRVLADQLLASCVRAREVNRLRLIAGDEGLSDLERKYLNFGGRFEKVFLDQKGTRRTFAESERAAWEVLAELPVEELYRLPSSLTDRQLKGY